jgi:hypothetical protein
VRREGMNPSPTALTHTSFLNIVGAGFTGRLKTPGAVWL